MRFEACNMHYEPPETPYDVSITSGVQSIKDEKLSQPKNKQIIYFLNTSITYVLETRLRFSKQL